MSGFEQIVLSLREQMQANLSRSDVLRSLIWPSGLVATALIGGIWAGAPTWILVLLSVLLVLALVLYGGAFLFCLIKDRDALRSERYTIEKMAIEQGLYGDNRIGLKEATVLSVSASKQAPALPESEA